jgi:hypothetical protein
MKPEEINNCFSSPDDEVELNYGTERQTGRNKSQSLSSSIIKLNMKQCITITTATINLTLLLAENF